MEPRLRPDWASALALQPGSQDVFGRAVQKAMDGKPTFDVLKLPHRPQRREDRAALALRPVRLAPGRRQERSRRDGDGHDRLGARAAGHERLRQSKAQYKDLVEASPNLIWACDSAFRFSFVSGAPAGTCTTTRSRRCWGGR